MWDQFRRWLNSAPLDDPIERQQAPLLQVMLIAISIAMGLALLNNQIAPNTVERRLLGTAGNIQFILFNTIGLILLRRGRFRLAVLVATTGPTLLLGLSVIALGLRNGAPFLIVFAVPITLAGLLAGRRALVAVIAISLATMILTLILQRAAPALTGFISDQGDPALRVVLVFFLITSVLGLFLDRFGHTLTAALNNALVRERELEHSHAALEARTAELEREIGERRHAEAALRDSEERYRLLAENSNDLISLIDLDNDGRRVYASPSFRTVLGYDPAELISASAFDLVHPDDLKHVAEQTAQLATCAAIQFTYRICHADGSWHWNEVYVTAFTRPDGRYAVSVGRDITERVQAVEALLKADAAIKEAHDQLAAILENAPAVAIQGYDENGVVLFWNKASEQLYGFSADAIIGKRLGGLILSEADSEEWAALVKHVLATNQPAPIREVVEFDGRW